MEFELFGEELFELYGVGGESTDAFGEFFGCAGVFVHFPAEGCLVQGDFFHVARVGGFLGELAREIAFGFLQFLEEIRANGEQIATGEFGDFAGVAEARAHDFGGVVEFFVVVVNGSDRLHARIFGGGVLVASP